MRRLLGFLAIWPILGCYGRPATLPTALMGDHRISSSVFDSQSAGVYYADGGASGGSTPSLGLGALATSGGASAAPPAVPPPTNPAIGPISAGAIPPAPSIPQSPELLQRRAERDADLSSTSEAPPKVPEPVGGLSASAPNPGAAFGAAGNRTGAIGKLFSSVFASGGTETARAPNPAAGFGQPPAGATPRLFGTPAITPTGPQPAGSGAPQPAAPGPPTSFAPEFRNPVARTYAWPTPIAGQGVAPAGFTSPQPTPPGDGWRSR